MNLNTDQQAAIEMLHSPENVFLTGAAGTGKSFLLRRYLEESGDDVALLASTGAAALVLGGRTFHSFFNLWNFQAGLSEMVASAIQNPYRLTERLSRYSTIVIDEVSMLDEKTMQAGERVARAILDPGKAWGGLRVVAVGDFCQLPPVQPGRRRNEPIEWVFDAEIWKGSGFKQVSLNQIMRTGDTAFMDVLSRVRRGECDSVVRSFLEGREIAEETADMTDGTRLFSRIVAVNEYNDMKLHELNGQTVTIDTEYTEQKAGSVQKIRKLTPFDDILVLKPGALVMIRSNDRDGRYANGSLGHFVEHGGDVLVIKLMESDEVVTIEKKEYELRDGDNRVIATARNFPLSLAWAMTVHKAQGATMDRVIADLRSLWESGHAYVAMSRTRTADGLSVLGWRSKGIMLDERVRQFYSFA